MATTHKRSRTGCWTCREAGYKCDEQKPFCGRCTRLKIVCKGYGVKLKWLDDAVSTLAKPPRKSRKKKAAVMEKEEEAFSPSSSSIISFASTPALQMQSPEGTTSSSSTITSPQSAKSMPLLPLRSSPELSYGLSHDDRWLLTYWVDQLSLLISVAPRTGVPTPFQRHLTAMAYEFSALRSTILSMAANHLAASSNASSLYLQAYRHQRDAIRELQRMIQEPEEMNLEPALATVMMMQVSSRLFGDEDEVHVANHLTGAKAMIARRSAAGGDAHLSSSSLRFLTSLFAYHDILSSVSRGSQPLLNHYTPDLFPAVEGEQDLKSIADVLLVVARISNLQHVIKARWAAEPFSPPLTEEENTMGRCIQQMLLAMDFNFTATTTTTTSDQPYQHDKNTDIAATAEAYRHAAFIYLYRTWLDIGAPNPISMEHISQCLTHLEQVDVKSPLTAAHVWPLFTAGCEAVEGGQRAFVMRRFEELWRAKRFPNLRRVARDVEVVWRAKDGEMGRKGEGGMAKVDCIQVILRGRGREVGLV
ncbi:fungal Zn binuclear cluster domain containing [Pyrenophora seminiperda CCB06]|uniref:Fungal Zn binuclear cluster domain containing n=1 Tax=Pyrenophora seminiperda CCB06 TaxID=1302712 RepID=A0A3M7M169_9PLEO|nr:fungal Zn binuclear cluster domain containing [Pyrenophora seminiperda CCB06]